MTNRRTSTAKSEGAARQPRRRAAATSAAAPDQAAEDTTAKAGARKRAAKDPVKKAAPRKVTAKKTTAEKATAKKAPAKRAATKTAAKKAATKKATRPKRATKRAAAPVEVAVTEQQTVSAADLSVNGGEPLPAEAAAPAEIPAPPAEIVAPPVMPEISVGTDAAFASVSALGSLRSRPLRNISEVRHFLRTNDVPIYFVGASPFNLLGLDRWVRNFSYINYYDPWDGAHPRVFSPTYKPYQEFQSGEEINNWLLTNPEVRAYIRRNAPRGVRPKIAMVFFDEQTEAICSELGYDLILPSAALREHLDSKMVTTRLGNEAGVPSVPNVMGRADTWEELRKLADDAGLGDELVVQTPYGDSGKTTFFISSESDWRKHNADIIGEDLKVMRRINNRAIAVEAVLTRCGTIVGPFMSELTGHPSLTPYRGGWCGNEMYPTVLPEDRRSEATQLIRRLGDRLSQEGYRGFFEVDILLDTDTDNIYLGELNPRISGASSITNVTAGAYADVPLFLFHLLEFLDVDFDIDVDEINERWEELAAADTWSQMVLKEPVDRVEQLTSTPPTGQYYIDERGTMVFNRAALDWHQLQNENEAFFLRIYGPGDYRWKGADLGIVVTKGRLQVDSVTGESVLSIRARHFIESLRAHYHGTPLAVSAETPS